MAKLVSFRLIGTAALCSAAFLLAGAAPYLHAAPITPGLTNPAPSVTVNDFRKGDRLPLFQSRAARQVVPPIGSQTRGKVPLGCDSLSVQ